MGNKRRDFETKNREFFESILGEGGDEVTPKELDFLEEDYSGTPETHSYEMAFKAGEVNYIGAMGKYRWSEEETRLLFENYKSRKTEWTKLKKLNRTKRAIECKANSLGLSQKFIKWSDKELEELRNSYKKHKIVAELSKELGRTRGAIRQKLHKKNIKKEVFWKKFRINYDFFKEWTEESAYTLGLVSADGCLSDYKGHYNIEISSKDKPLLENIRQIMKFTKKVEKERETFRLRIDNKIIYNDLISLRMHPRKSKNLIFPQVPDKYLSHFIRGFFDGDGSVFKLRGKRIVVKFSCWSPLFLEELQRIISEKCNVKSKKNHDNSIVYYTNESFKVLEFLYKDSNYKTRLKRKYDRFRKFTKEVRTFTA